MLSVFRAVTGSLLILFIPGYAVSWALFPKKKDLIERIVLSIGLSIALIPLTVFHANKLFYIPITFINTLIMILLIIGISVIVWKKRK